MRHVAIVVHDAERSGSVIALCRVVAALADKMRFTFLVGADGPLVGEFAALGVVLRLPRRERDDVLHRIAFAAVRGAVGDVDAVVVNSTAAVARAAALALPARHVVWWHELRANARATTTPAALRAVLDRGAEVVAVSSAAAADFAACAAAVDHPHHEVDIIGPAVPDEYFAFPVDAECRIASIVGGLGAPVALKGTETFLRAAAQLGPRARYEWLGATPNYERDSAAFREIARRLQVDVALLPATGEVPAFLRRLSLLWLPSWQEAAPLAALEAMACGRPALAFVESEGPATFVPPSLLLRGFDPAVLAARSRQLLDDDARWREASAEVRAAATPYRASLVATKWHALLNP